MPLSVPEKKEPQPNYEEATQRWIDGSKKELKVLDATAQATVAVAYALLAINDTLKQIYNQVWAGR